MRKTVLFFAPLLLAGPALAAEHMDAAAIDRAVSEFTGAAIGEPGGARLPVDRRLRLSPCGAPLQMEWYGRTNNSVQVRCPDAGWRIFVAVDTSAGGNGRAAVQAAPVVLRGEMVSIVVRGGGFSLSRQGEAMEDGAPGEWIKVRPEGDRIDPVRAQVLRPGQVGMDLP